MIWAVFGAVDFKQDKDVASESTPTPLTSARSADSFVGGQSWRLIGVKMRPLASASAQAPMATHPSAASYTGKE